MQDKSSFSNFFNKAESVVEKTSNDSEIPLLSNYFQIVKSIRLLRLEKTKKMNIKKPNYDLKADFFRKNSFLKRLAKDHISLADMKSDMIEWEVAETRSRLNIPCEYLVHYNLTTIIGTDENQAPLYGKRHTVSISFPPKYPIESPLLYMKSKVWHPNIKSDGRYAGRICGNTKGFGLSFDLTLLIMRIGEILQYKNYHAEHTPPFPEDAKVADWITSYAEPNNIVSKKSGLNTAFADAALIKAKTATKPLSSPYLPPVKPSLEVPQNPKPATPRKLKITGVRKIPKSKIKIERKP